MSHGGSLVVHRTRRLTAALLGGCLAACAAPGVSRGTDGPAIAVDGVVIRNQLAYSVTDVLIELPATGAFAGCGTVLPRSECRNRFQRVDYRRYPMKVSWREHGRHHATAEFVPEGAGNLRPDLPAHVEVTIFSPGEAGARLVQP